MVRKREDGRWEGRIVVGRKKNGDPIHRYVLARTQKELIVKLQSANGYSRISMSPKNRCTPTMLTTD